MRSRSLIGPLHSGKFALLTVVSEFLSGPAAWSDPNLLVTKLPARSGRGGNMTIKFATLLLAGTILGIIHDSAHAEADSTPEQASAVSAVLVASDAVQIGDIVVTAPSRSQQIDRKV